MDRAVEALAVCAEKLKKRNVVLARSVATEACRQAVNGAQFIERVKRETGAFIWILLAPKKRPDWLSWAAMHCLRMAQALR